MDNKYVTDIAKLSEQLSCFVAFVHYMDKREDYISFRDSTGFLGREEDSVFSDAIKTFGGRYDVIAYLYFIKDDTRFLPNKFGPF